MTMALPTPETPQLPIFKDATRDAIRGYRWEWKRTSGRGRQVTRVPVEISIDDNRFAAFRKVPSGAVETTFRW